jgi:hypothetical protein
MLYNRKSNFAIDFADTYKWRQRMKAGRATDGVVYPDVGHQISDLVSQTETPEGLETKAIAPRRKVDEYKSIVSTGQSRLDQLLRREIPPLSNFGYVPRPEGWNGAPAIFHDPQVRNQLHQLATSLSTDTKLQELADDLVTDSSEGPLNIQQLLTANFRGITFPADVESADDSLRFVQERSLYSLDELRQKLFDPKANSSEKGSALLQFRAKLDLLAKLSEWIQNQFSDLDYLELSRVKAPMLC